MVLAEIGPDQCGHQSGELRGLHPTGQHLRICAQAKLLSGAQCAPIRERIELVPNELNLAHEDVGADIADALDLFKKTSLFLRIAAGGLAEIPEIAAVMIEEHPGCLAQHSRRAFVIPGITGPIEDAGTFLPRRRRHLLGRGQAFSKQGSRRLERRVGADSGAEKEGCT